MGCEVAAAVDGIRPLSRSPATRLLIHQIIVTVEEHRAFISSGCRRPVTVRGLVSADQVQLVQARADGSAVRAATLAASDFDWRRAAGGSPGGRGGPFCDYAAIAGATCVQLRVRMDKGRGCP
jgi:hypothetical protein